jgi:hypothetical protein
MDRKWWTLLAVCAGTFMLPLDVTIVVVALPEMQAALHAGFGDVVGIGLGQLPGQGPGSGLQHLGSDHRRRRLARADTTGCHATGSH